jgi:hypothetical protein
MRKPSFGREVAVKLGPITYASRSLRSATPMRASVSSSSIYARVGRDALVRVDGASRLLHSVAAKLRLACADGSVRPYKGIETLI